jgi:hypothetical protein
MNLRLDDDHTATEAAGDLSSLDAGERDFSARNGHAVSREDRFGLIFVYFHVANELPMLIDFNNEGQPSATASLTLPVASHARSFS